MVGPPPSCKDPLACQVSPKYVILTPDNRVSRAAQISKVKHYKERSPKPLSRPFMGRYPPALFAANDFLIGKHLLRVGAGERGRGKQICCSFSFLFPTVLRWHGKAQSYFWNGIMRKGSVQESPSLLMYHHFPKILQSLSSRINLGSPTWETWLVAGAR